MVHVAQGLRIAVLVKQVPVLDSMALGPDGRLVRTGGLQMNDYCRRGVTTAVELARAAAGTVTSFTMGPDSAVAVLREAALCGVDRAVHLNDSSFAGSDTIATARALVAALRHQGGYDIVVTGMNSVDADTGQVPVQVAELLDTAVLTGVKRWSLEPPVTSSESDRRDHLGDLPSLRVELEHDEFRLDVEADLPVVISMAERSCDPCKHKDPASWPPVSTIDLTVLRAGDLDGGPWGKEASRTVVLGVEASGSNRVPHVISGSNAEALSRVVDTTLRLLHHGRSDAAGSAPVATTHQEMTEGRPVVEGADPKASRQDPPGGTILHGASAPSRGPLPEAGASRIRPVVALTEPGRPGSSREIVDLAAGMAQAARAEMVLVSGGDVGLPRGIRGRHMVVPSEVTAEDFHLGILPEMSRLRPSLVVAPSTPWGREVAARLAVSLDAGLTGDVLGVLPVDSVVGSGAEPASAPFLALKPAFGGGMVARIGYTSTTAMATVRRGAITGRGVPTAGLVDDRELPGVDATRLPLAQSRGRVRVESRLRVDDNSALFSARVILGLGQGVAPSALPLFEGWADRLGAALGATRKVTDLGWLPRSRQIGITAHSVAPDLYVAVGMSGRQTHMSGVRGAGVILAVNPDPEAEIFGSCDVGLVARWEDVMGSLVDRLADRLAEYLPR